MSISFDPPRSPAPLVEHVAWTLTKDTRRVRAILREHPLGVELRCVYENNVLWTEVFRHYQPPLDLDLAIDDVRCAWEQKGWTRP